MNETEMRKGTCCGRQMESPIGVIHLEADAEGITSLYIEGIRSDGRRQYRAEWEETEMPDERSAREGGGDCQDRVRIAEAGVAFLDKADEDDPGTAGSVMISEDDIYEDISVQVAILDQAEQELHEYFAGMRTEFTVPLHLSGTEFQLKAWNALRRIPYGETRSYSEMAAMIGNPKACRAIGGANNKNPVMLFVPCHRVVGKGGALVGFAGGLDVKQYLLELEQGGVRAKKDRLEPDRQDMKKDGLESDRQDMKKELLEPESDGLDVKKDGEYTLEDYYALPKERRVELIDGVFYDMASTSFTHQCMTGRLYMLLAAFIDARKGSCVPVISPFDVQLDCDDFTMVQPDVAVVCDRAKITERCIYGAPDLVIEVLSDSSVTRDTVIKLEKYQKAGVREYWIVEIKRKKVLVYEFEKGELPTLYGMDSQIPVGIFEGKCVIDFAEIWKTLEL